MSKDNSLEPTADDIYLAKLTMDEVGADIETEGHVAVTDENRTLDPFTDKGVLANALDEALDYSNPNIDPTELPKDVSTEEAIVPKNGDTTMDEAPKKEEAKDAKDALADALEDAVAMDEGERGEDVVSEPDEEMHHRWEMDEIKKNVPEVPESLDPEPKDGGRIVYLTYTFTVDPSKYRSANYQPIANAGGINAFSKDTPTNPQQRLMPDETVEVAEEVEVDSESEPTPKEEKAAAKEANKEEKQEKEAEDEAPSKEVLDYATFIDGSSFICCDEVAGIDYSKITMDAGAKKATERPSCKTTFAQCRAKNPLFCRYHGPKLLEKDIKTAIAANLGKGCTVSVTKDKGQKNPLTFRLTIGCPASMKKNVEFTVHQFMTNNPGISSPEEYKDLGNGKQTMEFDMDILQADKPPSKKDLKGQASVYETEKAKAKGKVMPVVGETPAKIEKIASQGGVQPQEEEPQEEEPQEEEPQEEEPQEEDIQAETDLEQQALKAEEWEQMTGPMLQEQYEEAISDMPSGVDANAWKELTDAFEKALAAKDHEAAKKAIEGLNALKDGSNMSIVKKGENTQGNEDSGSDDGGYEDDAAKEMWHEIDGIANDNKDIMGGEIYNNYSAATKALDMMEGWHNSLESLKSKLKELPENPTSAVDVLSVTSLENAIQQAQQNYDEQKSKTDALVKQFKDSVDEANESATEGIKGIFGGSVYNSVKNVAAAVFPNGKPDGVDSAEEMIDYIADDFIDAGNALMKKYPDFSLDVCKKQFGITEKYQEATTAAKEFNDAVKEFKTKIDAVKDKKAAMALKDYSDKVADAASKFQKAHNGFKNAITLAKLGMDDFEGMKAAETRENKGNGEMAAPTAEQIHDAAVKLAKYMYNGSPEYMKYFENTIDTLVNYELASSNIDKQKFGEESAIQKAIHYYYPMLEKLDVAPELMTTLKKLVDMPKKGKKGKKGKESDAEDLSGLLKEPHTLSAKIPPLIQEALDDYNNVAQEDAYLGIDTFGDFKHFVKGDYGGNPGELLILMDNKEKDDDGNPFSVSTNSLLHLKDTLDSILMPHGLKVEFEDKIENLAALGRARFFVTAANKPDNEKYNKPAGKGKKTGTIDFKKAMAEKAKEKEKESMNNDFSSVLDKIDKAKSNGIQKVANADTASMKAFFEGLVEKGDIEGAKNYLNAWKEFSDELGDSSGSSSKEGDIKKEFNEVIDALNKKGIAKDFHTKLFTGYLDKGDIESAKVVVETMKDVLKAMGGSISKPSNGGSDDAISKKVASMPLEKKLAIAVEALKDKLAKDPTNMELSKKLSLYQKKLDEIKKKKHEDDYLE